jgi:hypothetical protein
MPRQELSDAELSLLCERIALAKNYSELTHHEAEALDAVGVRLRRYGAALFLSRGERHRLDQIFEKAGCFSSTSMSCSFTASIRS